MEDKSVDTQNVDYENTTRIEKKLGLPIVALLLNVLPFIYFVVNPDVIMLILISLFPFCGVIIGIVALCYGKKRIGTLGVILSIFAIVWPIIFVAAVVLFSYTGVSVKYSRVCTHAAIFDAYG